MIVIRTMAPPRIFFRVSTIALIALFSAQACSKKDSETPDGGKVDMGVGGGGMDDRDMDDRDMGDRNMDDRNMGDRDMGDGRGGEGGGVADMGGGDMADACANVDCIYGNTCEDGNCVSLCNEGEIYCGGHCIDPLSNDRYCGATAGCDGGNTEGIGGASGFDFGGFGGDSNWRDTAGEWCEDAYSCEAGTCEQVSLYPGSNAVVEREGFRVQCQQWNGDICEKPYIAISAERILEQGKVEGCVDDTTTLRPIWNYDEGQEEAQTFCAVATGNSEVIAVNVASGISALLGGWMYGSFSDLGEQPVECVDFRNYSDVNSPGDVPNVVWSFELMTKIRAGQFTSMTCAWPDSPLQ